TMTAALENAIKDRRWIVVTGWTPHWKHAKWNLKYLDDPEKVFGHKEHIATIVRKGLKQDMPEIYAFLDNFRWAPEDMAEVMLMAQDKDTTYAEAAERWIRKNRDIVNGWLDGH
ncbi:MAG: glycine/betaine ABC transporter substrate-binding protein, partial [Desulfobacterales bacterium]|nr:glycine/betaine ABC transporter substrate-binding protein [Desulfobacterales bacterium]